MKIPNCMVNKKKGKWKEENCIGRKKINFLTELLYSVGVDERLTQKMRRLPKNEL